MRPSVLYAVCGGRAFSMIELLAVLAVAAVLLGFVIPMATGARVQYAKVETKGNFYRYNLALEAFKAQYGHYPAFASSPVAVNEVSGRFVELLTGRSLSGGAISDAFALSQNPQAGNFLQLSPRELTAEGLLKDAFGQTELYLYIDANGDGFLDGLDNVRGSLGWQSRGNPTVCSWQ